jgi:hypothetical protein
MRLPIYHGLRFVSSPFPRYYSDSLAADSTSLVKQKYLGISTGSAFVILALCLRKQRTGCKQKNSQQQGQLFEQTVRCLFRRRFV